jgi:hypothetical protein
MGFLKEDLKNDLLTMFNSQSSPNNMSQHFSDLSEIYDSYCRNAKDSLASNELIVTGKTQFNSVISIYPLDAPSLTNYSSFIENACIAYWGACIFNLTNLPLGWTSLVSINITPMSPNSIKTTLENSLTLSKGNPDMLAENMANIIHLATTTVSLVLGGMITITPVTSLAYLES